MPPRLGSLRITSGRPLATYIDERAIDAEAPLRAFRAAEQQQERRNLLGLRRRAGGLMAAGRPEAAGQELLAGGDIRGGMAIEERQFQRTGKLIGALEGLGTRASNLDQFYAGLDVIGKRFGEQTVAEYRTPAGWQKWKDDIAIQKRKLGVDKLRRDVKGEGKVELERRKLKVQVEKLEREERGAKEAAKKQPAFLIPDIKKRATVEKGLRGDYFREAKPFIKQRAAADRLYSIAGMAPEEIKTGAQDMAIIFSYMKILDPGSTVREGEYATAEKARGVPADIRARYNKVREGKFLDDDQRREFVSVALTAMKEARRKHILRNRRWEGIAERSGVDPLNVTIMDFPRPTARHISGLKRVSDDAARKKEFDEKFGPGMADYYLSLKQP